MNKKHLIPIAISALCVLATTAALVNKTDFHFVGAVTKEYHLTFDKDNVISHSRDDDWEHDGDGVTYFTIGNNTAIDNTYEFYTYDEFTYLDTYYGDVANFDKEDSIFEIEFITATYSNFDFNIVFSLINRATIDLDESNILYRSSDMDYDQKMYFELYSEEGDRNYYSLVNTYNFPSHYGKSFKLLQIDLFFTC